MTGEAPGTYRGIRFDEFQRRAVEGLEAGRSVIVCAPTGAGKTLIAEYAIEKAVRERRRLIYTAPIKAINNQKFRDFSAAYPGAVGIKTGDVSIHVDAPILLMTTEIFRNMIFEDPGRLADVDYAVLDEIHFLDDIERGTVWEECIIFAPPNIKILALSATIPNAQRIADWVRHVRPETDLQVIYEMHRPVPLEHRLWIPGVGVRKLEDLRRAERCRDGLSLRARPDEHWVPKMVRHLRQTDRLPCIFFAFSRRECEKLAEQIRLPLLSREERRRILQEYDRLCRQFQVEGHGSASRLRELLSFGVCFHHAGLLPTLKEIVERIFSSGLLKVLFATETFALGVNMPARSVVFSDLFKFDGRRTSLLKVREYHQMAGRAGRRGIDRVGHVYSFVSWPDVSAETVGRLIGGQVEPIRSQFNLSYATLLSLYDRLQEKVVEAARRSLSNFLEDRGKVGLGERIRRLRAKLRVLRELGYLRNKRLTAKGRFASKIYGYEVPLTELVYAGVLERVSAIELCAILCGIAFEGKKGVFYFSPRDRRYRRLERICFRIVERVVAAEGRAGVEQETKLPDFRLSATVIEWAKGAGFDALGRTTNADAGDVIRAFRLTIQILRNLAAAVDDPSLARRLREAMHRMNRDEVDAERQLRLGAASAAASEELPLDRLGEGSAE